MAGQREVGGCTQTVRTVWPLVGAGWAISQVLSINGPRRLRPPMSTVDKELIFKFVAI